MQGAEFMRGSNVVGDGKEVLGTEGQGSAAL